MSTLPSSRSRLLTCALLAQVTLAGDLVTLCAAVAVISYLEVGQRLRTWMPVFLYACPVTGESLCFHVALACA